MYKVVIADDEERICRLIQALVDWESMGLEIVGTAENGIEALSMVEAKEPDILITDIRMPGCDGLELIEKVKEVKPQLEIIIISGYAHFEYAQTAIKYGVGDYLLKPVSKDELRKTLEKLTVKIQERIADKKEEMQKREDREKDLRRVRNSFLTEYEEHAFSEWNAEGLNREYHLRLQNGIYQGIVFKIDCKNGVLGQPAVRAITDRIVEVMEAGPALLCHEFLFHFKGTRGIGILNYPEENKGEIISALRESFVRLEMQKELMGPVNFTIALGEQEEEFGKIGNSLKHARRLIEERILRGTGRILEGKKDEISRREFDFQEKYARDMSRAVSILNKEALLRATDELEQGVLGEKEISGYEILELIHSAGNLFLNQMNVRDKAGSFQGFEEACDNCSGIQELFDVLRTFQEKLLEEKIKDADTEEVRPIRLAKQYIRKHYGEQITQEEVSEKVGLSPSYFSVLFKKETGEGFARYLIQIRMEEAKNLLRETNLSVPEICRKIGYNDVKHFSHSFEKVVGIRPGTYRKLYG